MTQITVLKHASHEDDPFYSPLSPSCVLTLARCTRDSEDRIILTRELATDSEVDICIDGIISQLEKARTQAKRHLASGRVKRSTKI